jgi:enoyl-CoA hydratase
MAPEKRRTLNKDNNTVRFEIPFEGIARIVLNRPDARNAQDAQLLYSLDDAFQRAAQQDNIRVVILAGDGPHFSSGHDLMNGPRGHVEGRGTWGGTDLPGAESTMAIEQELYIGLCRRWRNIPKPTIAEVQGKAVSAGLMLAWVCDLIVCSEDAQFMDNTVTFGCSGAEWFAHPWEVGPRKAKEMLFAADWLTAEDAFRLGMVNHVVPSKDLTEFTIELAIKIARQPSFALKLAKEAVNQAVDIQGQDAAIRASFSLHQLAHSHNMQLFGAPVDPHGLPEPFRSRYLDTTVDSPR